MPKYIIDSNVVLTWLGLQDDLRFEKSVNLFSSMIRKKVQILAPDFLIIELINVLKWRYKISEDDVNELVKRVVNSGIKFMIVDVKDMTQVQKLVYKWDLTAYDAIYLQCAVLNKVRLVTLDKKLLEVEDWCVGLDEWK